LSIDHPGLSWNKQAMLGQEILRVENVSKTYRSGSSDLTVLHALSVRMEQGDTLSIVGPSGSGKTTLLGLCAGLDQPTTGEIWLAGKNLNSMSEDDRASWRNQVSGFVFQNFQLLPTLTALENVMVPLELRGNSQVESKAQNLLERVGLKDRIEHYPAQLSGGEQQRVALARAFISEPKLLFADEPTGNLDRETSERIVDLLFELNRNFQTSLILITHDFELAQKTERIIRLKGGRLVEDTDLQPVS
jgi:putative ABC transport system ATP-binding protein